MGAVESLPSLSYHDHRHHNHRLFGSSDRQTATSAQTGSTGNKPVRSASICISSCALGPGDDSGDFLTGDKGQVKRSSTARGLFRASLRRYSYRGPSNWIHGKDKSGAADAGVGCLGVASNRMPSAEDVRIDCSYTRSIDAVVPQLSASMPHLPTHVESLRITQLPPLATNVRVKKGSTSIVAAAESIPFPTIEFAAGDSSAVAGFEGSGEQAPLIAASGIAEFRQKLARRLSRSSRQSHRRGGNSAREQHQRSSATDAGISPNVDDATNASNRHLLVESDSFAVAMSADARPVSSSELDCEGILAKGLGLLHIGETGESLDMPLAFGTSSFDVSSADSGSRLLSESIDSLLEMRLFQAMGEAHTNSVVSQTAGVAPRLQTLSASSSMSSLSTSSSSLTLSGDEPAAEPRPAVQLQSVSGASGYSGVSASGSEILDYEDFMYLSACENHRPRLLPSATANDDDSAVRIASRSKGACGDYEDARKWWPRCVMPAQNMQYMPKLSLILGREGHKLMGDRHHSSESIPLPWLQSDSPRLLRARSEGAIGRAGSDTERYAANGVKRRMDFWDVLGRCPMRPTSSLALASLKDMAKSCADVCGYVGSNRKSDCENRGAEDSGYVASSLADSASDSDEDSDSDNESTPAYGMLLGLSAKQSPSTGQRGSGIGPQLQRGGSSSAGNKHRTKRVLSEPMQYILYNSYLRYYGRPGEAQ
ncbi:hypothetical protein GGI16_004447 [Coemansia sp. S142-1]|nr:hypothetical protein LPJ71_002633 [Coemansia sp. S17]KAJ2097868.1 hypothetical protein GGI16_004447 [Coemansia sp. S142-1]